MGNPAMGFCERAGTRSKAAKVLTAALRAAAKRRFKRFLSVKRGAASLCINAISCGNVVRMPCSSFYEVIPSKHFVKEGRYTLESRPAMLTMQPHAGDPSGRSKFRGSVSGIPSPGSNRRTAGNANVEGLGAIRGLRFAEGLFLR